MAVATLAEAAAATGSLRWAAAAEEIAEVLFARLRRADGRWLRSLQGDDARHLAMAGDYAWVLEAATRVAELTGRARWAERAMETAAGLLELFSSPDGVLYTTGRDAEPLVVRPRDLSDGALPSANAVALGALLRLGALSGDESYITAATAIASAMTPLLESSPMAFADLVAASSLLTERVEIVVTGNRPDLLGVVRSRWLPDAVVAWGEPTDSPLWSGRAEDAAYVCRNYACLVPAQDAATLAVQLDHLGG